MLPTNIAESGAARTGRTQVFGLSEHRSRRRQRFQLARAIHSDDPVRLAVIAHLSELSDLTGADRAAAVWIDEYGESAPHPHVLLDLVSDRPRRSFAAEPLERAWEIGLPGVYDSAGGAGRTWADGGSMFTVALGSDGARSWFLVCDSVGPRPRLGEEDRQRALFLSGECASALLHQDLDTSTEDGVVRLRAPETKGFVGFPVLQDCEGREDRPEVSAKVEQRFLVVRLARALVDGDVGYGAEGAWGARVDAVRDQLSGRSRKGGDPVEAWEPLLGALASRDLEATADGLVVVGERAEVEGHVHGAVELYRCAFDAAAAVMYADAAVDASRYRGRVLRRAARWEAAVRSYEVAYEVALAAGFAAKAAQSLGGLAAVRQELGNLPKARSGYQDALELAGRSGSRDVLASIHHGLLALEHAAGNLDVALRHGWIAVGSYEDVSGRVRCLASLAGALVDLGDHVAAEDAWSVVARDATDVYYRTYALDALAYLAALRGDLGDFERRAAACDALGWESGPRSAKAEILHYRGLSYQALGMRDAAERWLRRAIRHAEEFGLNRTLFRSEEALDRLLQEEVPREFEKASSTKPSAPREVREGLREMRRAVAGASV